MLTLIGTFNYKHISALNTFKISTDKSAATHYRYTCEQKFD